LDVMDQLKRKIRSNINIGELRLTMKTLSKSLKDLTS